MNRPLLIYVAGPLSNGGKVGGVGLLHNMHNMFATVDSLERHGREVGRIYYAYAPCSDAMEIIIDGQKDLPSIQAKSLELMRRCDVVYRMLGESPGADNEVMEAKACKIPVVQTMRELDKVVAK